MNNYKATFEMKRIRLYALVVCFALVTATNVAGAESLEQSELEVEKTAITPFFNAPQADWVFAGMVTNESGERYNYYFQMQRNNSQFHAIAMLIDSQSKEVLLFEESNARIEHPESSNWRVGQTFMQFNPINNSWVFGVKTKVKKGFNFKVDMLPQADNKPSTSQDLRSGVELLVNQTGRLNGHLKTNATGKEQFVTAPKAWFRQVWVSKQQESLHPLLGVLCQFNDGSGFYSMNLQEPDAIRGAVAGWRDIQGLPVSMSQFVSVKEAKDGVWHIRIPSPKVRLSLQDALAKEKDKHQLIAGLIEGVMPGFCTISQDQIGQQLQPEPQPEKINIDLSTN